ncbi:flavodoxin domain-containing protein [Thermodesulforhabdus norvegica]|uniref:Flavodoxin domain-containing protein n=1 Tax=Thermodesulforhabdus norvegica TaxID=39841 RepID=A0A1I4V1A0_9BACT|nr:flavodoxin domain-containing protein [Thermodesulforhabdus norvegica]SFM94921.1 Flavodoxin domain-containing protein [Thermodesulforhabdus norvegica]
MKKALIIYATRTQNTKGIAELIAEGLRMSGVEVTLMNANDPALENVNFDDYDALILGSATYHGEMMQHMKTLLFRLESANLSGKVGGSFGAFGWSGEAPVRIFDTMANVFGMKMVSGPLRLKSPSIGGAIQMAQEYGKEIAKAMGS